MPRGTILTSDAFYKNYRDTMRNKQGFNVWNEAYGTVGMYEKAGMASLDYDYGKAMGEAYVAAQGQKNIIAESGLGKGFKQELYGDIDESLIDAYAQYRNNYLENAEKIAATANQYRQGITTELETMSKNTEKLSNSVYDYLSYLYKENPSMFTAEGNQADNRWSQFLTDDVDEEGNVLGKRLMTKQELLERNFDKSEYIDEFGNTQYDYTLGQRGVDYYDLLLNYNELPEGSDLQNYEAWLYDESQKEKGDYAGLYDWYKSYNPYAAALDNPRNAGLIRTAFGMISTDYAYQFAERFGGLNETEIKELYSDYEKKVNELQFAINKTGKDKGADITKEISGYIGELKNMADKFGILDDIDKYFDDSNSGLSWSVIEQKMNEYANGTQDQKEMAGKWFQDFSEIIVPGAAGAAVGIATLSAAGPVGTAIGVIIALGEVALSIGLASDETNKQRNKNKEQAQNANDLYKQLVIAMTNASLAKKKEAEINEYQRRRNQFI